MGKLDPWISEFKEIIDVAVTLAGSGLDAESRIAVVLLDNCVEFMYKAYLRIKKRAVGKGANQITLKDWESNVSRYFNSLTDEMKKRGPSAFDDDIVEDSILYHEIRNKLYHSDVPMKTPDSVFKEQLELVLKILEILYNCKYKPLYIVKSTTKHAAGTTTKDTATKGREERLIDSIENAKKAVADFWTQTSDGWRLEDVGRVKEKVALSLLEAYPKGRRVTEIAKECGINQSSVSIVVTGRRGDAKFFELVTSGLYRLSIDGINWVIREVVPNITRK